MPRNVYFTQGYRGEQNLYEDIVIEALKIYGQEVYYLPRKIVTRDMILNEDRESYFDDSYMIEMYIEDIEGFGGDGNLMSKFGLEIRDEATFIVAKRTWNKLVGFYNNAIDNFRPNEGDLIYLPMSSSFFEISFVEHEQPFYQLNNLPVYKLQCKLFEYNDEDFKTGLEEIDQIQTVHADAISMVVQDISGYIDIGTRLYQVIPNTAYIQARESLEVLISERDALQTQLVSAQELLTTYEGQYSDLVDQKSQMLVQLNALDVQIASMQQDIASLQAQLNTLTPGTPEYNSVLSQLNSLLAQLSSLQANRSNLYDAYVSIDTSIAAKLAQVNAQSAIVNAIQVNLAQKTTQVNAQQLALEDTLGDVKWVSGVVIEQDPIQGEGLSRTIQLADIETNITNVIEFYISTSGDVNTYLVNDPEYIGTPDISAQIYEIYDINDNVDYTFQNDDSAQNFDFEKEGNSFIDFSESNPFGEPK